MFESNLFKRFAETFHKNKHLQRANAWDMDLSQKSVIERSVKAYPVDFTLLKYEHN
jgi:hypothetical protein